MQVPCLNGSLRHLAICPTIHFNDGEAISTGIVSNDWFYADKNAPDDFLIKLYAGDEVAWLPRDDTNKCVTYTT